MDIKQSLVWWANSFYWAFYSTQPKFFPFFLYLWQSQSVYHHCCCKIKNKNWNNLVKISKTLQHKVFFMVCFRILSEVCQSLTLYFCRADCWNSLKTTGWVEVFYDFIKRKYKSQGWQLEPSVKRGSELWEETLWVQKFKNIFQMYYLTIFRLSKLKFENYIRLSYIQRKINCVTLC